MSGHIEEGLLALYSSGDLPAEEMEAISEHAEHCLACRKSLEEYEELRAFIVDSVREPAIEELQAVRAELAITWRQPQRLDKRWAWLLTAAAASAFFWMAGWNVEQHPTAARPPQHLAVKPATATERSVVPLVDAVRRSVPVARVRHRHVRDAGIREVSFVASAHQPSMIKITTEDPNVVIVWQPGLSTEEER